MAEALALAAAALLAAALAAVSVLAVRRAWIARDERRRRELEPQLRPLAFALMEGEAVDVATLDERQSLVLAAILARYAQQLAGSSHERISAYFEREGYVLRELKHTKDRRVWRRAVACHSLGDMGSQLTIPALLQALGDPAPAVREAAARSRGLRRAVDAVEPLVRALVGGEVPRAIAAQALLAVGASALPSLRELTGDDEDGVRARAVELVGLLGEAADAGPLLARLRDPSAEVRAKAARALGRLGADEAAVELRTALTDRIPFVRATAAIALGLVGDRDAASDLVALAREDAFEPARAAAEALARIDPARLVAEAAQPGAGPHLVEAADMLAARAA